MWTSCTFSSSQINTAFVSQQEILPQQPPCDDEMVDCSSKLLKWLCGMWLNSLVRTTISLAWEGPGGLSLGNVEVTSCREEQWHLAKLWHPEQKEGFLKEGKKSCFLITKHYHKDHKCVSSLGIKSFKLLNHHILRGNGEVLINGDTWYWRPRFSQTC